MVLKSSDTTLPPSSHINRNKIKYYVMAIYENWYNTLKTQEIKLGLIVLKVRPLCQPNAPIILHAYITQSTLHSLQYTD